MTESEKTQIRLDHAGHQQWAYLQGRFNDIKRLVDTNVKITSTEDVSLIRACLANTVGTMYKQMAESLMLEDTD